MRGIAAAHVTEVGDSARLFALANLAMADALISCWESKLHYSFWRPLTAIQEGDADGNDRTVGDPSWQPLINTPNYPDYTSGLNSVSGSATGVLARFFGTDEIAFTVATSAPQAVQKTRSYLRFSDAAQDVVDARVWLGIHFRFADEVARRQGDRVAGWVVGHYLRPAPGRGR